MSNKRYIVLKYEDVELLQDLNVGKGSKYQVAMFKRLKESYVPIYFNGKSSGNIVSGYEEEVAYVRFKLNHNQLGTFVIFDNTTDDKNHVPFYNEMLAVDYSMHYDCSVKVRYVDNIMCVTWIRKHFPS